MSDNSSKEQRLIDFIFHSKTCPYFNDPPVCDDDIEFIAPHWVFCEYEDKCLDRDRCPVLPDIPMFPRMEINKNE